MSVIEQWFSEASNEGVKVFHHEGIDFIIYKGYKISRCSGIYAIEDVRRSDFYDEVKVTEYSKMIKLGFIKGVDYIVNRRDLRRVGIYTRLLERLYTDKISYRGKLCELDKKEFYEKKLRNCQENIHRNIDLLFLYRSRIGQYNLKYVTNEGNLI